MDVKLTKEMQDMGGDVWYQDIFAQVTLYETNLTVKSEVIEVNKSDFSHPQPEGVKVVKTGKLEEKKGEKEDKCPRCDKDFTLDELQAVFTSAAIGDLGALLKSLNTYRKKFELNTCAKKAHFFAQCIEESGRDLTGALKGENLNYTPQQLVIQFDNFRSKYTKGSSMQNSVYMGYSGEQLAYKDRKKAKPTDEAYKYGKTQDHPANQKKIAEIAYGSRNGNITPEDAWNFIGRGLLQITGRDNYAKVQKQIDLRASDSKVNVFDSVPETGYTPHHAAVTGMAEWVHKSLYSFASKATKNNDDEIVNNIVNILNDATVSRAKRIVHYRGGTASAKNSATYSAPKDKNGNPKYKPTKEIFKIDECLLLTGKKKEEKEGKMAPWVPFAIKELEKYGGIRQIKSPLKEKVVEYFKVSKADWYDHTGYWCGAFVRWCFAQTNDYNYVFDSYNSVTAYNWLPKEQAQKRNSKLKGCDDLEYLSSIDEIFVGAIIVFNYSHVAFVVGQSTDGNSIFYLGGNQSDKAPEDGPGKRTICIGKISKSGINTKFWLSKPKKYEPTDDEKQLPKMNVSAYELDYSSTR